MGDYSTGVLDVRDADVRAIFERKHGDPRKAGWAPRLRWRFGYFTPDDVYESLVANLVQPATQWLDVGCGRDLFPSNPQTAQMLASRCKRLVGIDPSPNVLENPLLHEAHQASIEGFETAVRFDLVTLRMVAEHIAEPDTAVAGITRLLAPGGRIVVYTVNRCAPLTMVSRLVPFRLHHPIKQLIWGTEEQDTFPVEYRMNTRTVLRELFSRHGCDEEAFIYLDDCRTFARFRLLSICEVVTWKLLRTVGLHYPETCLLGVYRPR